MIEIPTNPDAEALKLIIWLLIAVLIIMLTIVGYLLTFGIGAVKTNLGKLTDSFENMTNAITELKVTVASIKTQFESANPIVTNRLNSHSNILTQHEGRIKFIETEHNLFHRKTCIDHEKEN
jgi:flagellar basal body-associated protein FliL